MKIAELEAHHEAYVDAERTIRAMVDNHKFPAVFSICIESFPHIVPAIQFRKKKNISPETPDLLAFITICKFAPLLFEHAAIQSLLEFVKSSRVLAQHDNNYLSTIEAAQNREQLAHLLWNHLEKQPGWLQSDIRKQLGVVQEEAVKIVELWEELGVINRKHEDRSYRLYFRTRPDVEEVGLCHECGVRGKGRMEAFFRPTKCGKCGAEGYYHIDYSDTQ